MTGKPKRFLLAQRACAEFLPPVLHQAAILSQHGEVTLLDASSAVDAERFLTPQTVHRVRVVSLPTTSGLAGYVRRLQNLKQYERAFHQQLATCPDVVIAYDPDSSKLLLQAQLPVEVLRIVHLHELPDPALYESSRRTQAAVQYLLQHLHRADLVVVPDKGRAVYVREVAHLDREPVVVMNCPRRLEALPSSLLVPYLQERGLGDRKIVHYQGAIGREHRLDQIVLSMNYWPDNAIFLIVGGGDENYRCELQQLAAAHDVSHRLIFIGYVPYDQVFRYARGATVGVALYNVGFKNTELSAGSSNKRLEYVALGIPQVTNNVPYIDALYVQPGVATTAPHDNAEAIGKAIAAYLDDDVLCNEVFKKARALHLGEYNYEHQMEPLLSEISRLHA